MSTSDKFIRQNALNNLVSATVLNFTLFTVLAIFDLLPSLSGLAFGMLFAELILFLIFDQVTDNETAQVLGTRVHSSVLIMLLSFITLAYVIISQVQSNYPSLNIFTSKLDSKLALNNAYESYIFVKTDVVIDILAHSLTSPISHSECDNQSTRKALLSSKNALNESLRLSKTGDKLQSIIASRQSEIKTESISNGISYNNCIPTDEAFDFWPRIQFIYNLIMLGLILMIVVGVAKSFLYHSIKSIELINFSIASSILVTLYYSFFMRLTKYPQVMSHGFIDTYATTDMEKLTIYLLITSFMCMAVGIIGTAWEHYDWVILDWWQRFVDYNFKANDVPYYKKATYILGCTISGIIVLSLIFAPLYVVPTIQASATSTRQFVTSGSLPVSYHRETLYTWKVVPGDNGDNKLEIVTNHGTRRYDYFQLQPTTIKNGLHAWNSDYVMDEPFDTWCNFWPTDTTFCGLSRGRFEINQVFIWSDANESRNAGIAVESWEPTTKELAIIQYYYNSPDMILRPNPLGDSREGIYPWDMCFWMTRETPSREVSNLCQGYIPPQPINSLFGERFNHLDNIYNLWFSNQQ